MVSQNIFAAGALLCALVLSLASAQDAASHCLLSPVECTCSQQPASGTCTRPASSQTKCLQGDCTESFRCDCWGFEKCSISACGKFVPVGNASLSREVEFQCKSEADGSQCRRFIDYMDTVEGAGNARDSAVVLVDEAVVDEREVAIEMAAAMNYKLSVLGAVRALDRHNENVTDAEITTVSNDANVVIASVEGIMVGMFVLASTGPLELNYHRQEVFEIHKVELPLSPF